MTSTGASNVERSSSRLGGRAAEYATAMEFCDIFERDMKPLYQLSLVLTGSHDRAEECFLGALESCKSANVFRNWAKSWSRLSVIESAIRVVRPTPNASPESEPQTAAEDYIGVHPEAAHVMRLSTFDRFIFVLSILDRYSVRDCAILLRCTRQDIDRARGRAIDFIAEAGLRMTTPNNSITTSSASI